MTRDDAAERQAHETVLLTLVPNSSIQFLDLVVSAGTIAQTRRRFFEESDESGEPSLHIGESGDDSYYHPTGSLPHDPRRVYALDGLKAIAPFLDRWLPVPFMRVSQQDDSSRFVLDEGPSNWTRAFITAEPGGIDEARYRVVLAIDTAVEADSGHAARNYAAPTLDDLKSGASFRFSDDVNDIAWFVSEAWVDDWIREAFEPARIGESSAAEAPGALQPLATYLTLLSALKESCDLPALRFLGPNAVGAYAESIAVDLAIDFGTSRTCAFLEERIPAAKPSQAPETRPAPEPLTVRDLSRPWQTCKGVFSSRLVFARASFGNEALSRWSGRTQAFAWPLPARVGPEAEHLTADAGSSDTCFGVASPMNYLWDEAPSRHVWRYADAGTREVSQRNPIVSGSVLAHLTEAGEFVDARSSHIATTKPRFSRSSLLTLSVAELILHAAREINSPTWRSPSNRSQVARRLDRILVTPPAGLTDTEIAILRRRYEAAVKLVWHSMGWAGDAHPLAPPPPSVRIVADTATSAQIAYLDNEIGFKLRGRADSFLALTGRARAGFAGARVLRMATLDVGAATSSLSVATYELGTGNALSVSRQLCEGFSVGSEAILREFIARFILPALSNRLADCKHPEPYKLISALLYTDERGRPQWVGDTGRRLILEMLTPAAMALLRLYGNSEADAGDAPSEPTIASLVASVGGNASRVADRLDVIAADEGADGFAPLDVPVPFLMRDLAAAAGSVLKPMLDSSVQALAVLDCDVVFLTGAGARLPIVIQRFCAGMPLRPDRIIPLSDHRFSTSFPSADHGSPDKLAAVVGALVQSRGVLGSNGPEIVLKTADRSSSGMFIGKISESGHIASDDVLFEIPASSRIVSRSGAPEQARLTAAALPLAIGVRTPSLTSWQARPTWVVERNAALPGKGPKLPLKFVLEFNPGDRTTPFDLKLASAVDRDGCRLDPAETVLRLKTHSFADGHWLDSGELPAHSTGAGA